MTPSEFRLWDERWGPGATKLHQILLVLCCLQVVIAEMKMDDTKRQNEAYDNVLSKVEHRTHVLQGNGRTLPLPRMFLHVV